MLAYVYGKLYVHELGTEAEHPNVVVLWLTTDLSGLQVLVTGGWYRNTGSATVTASCVHNVLY